MKGTKSSKSSSPRQTVSPRLLSRQAKESLRATCSELTSFGLPVGVFSPHPLHVFWLSSLQLSQVQQLSLALPFHPWPILPLYQVLPPAKVRPCQRDPGGSSSYWRNKPFEQMCVIMKMGPAGKAEVFIAHLACGPGPHHPPSVFFLQPRVGHMPTRGHPANSLLPAPPSPRSEANTPSSLMFTTHIVCIESTERHTQSPEPRASPGWRQLLRDRDAQLESGGRLLFVWEQDGEERQGHIW